MTGRYNTLTDEERLRRLAVGNQTRMWRADLRAAIRAQEYRELLIDTILNPRGVADVRGYRTTALDGIKVRRLLAMGVGLGPSRVAVMLRQASVSQEATLTGLSQADRATLVRLIEESNTRRKALKKEKAA